MRTTALLPLIVVCLGVLRGTAATPGPANEFCPVMTDEKTVPTQYHDHDGRRVYFCCKFCKAQFIKSPGEYMGNLPKAPDAEHAHARAGETPHDHAEEVHAAAGEADEKAAHDHAAHGPDRTLLSFFGKLHPVIVHFPIALVLAAFAAELLLMVTTKEFFKSASRFMLPLAAFMAVAAAAAGWTAAWGAGYVGELAEVLEQHRWFGIATLTAAVLAAILQFVVDRKQSPRLTWGYRLVLLIAVLLISKTGHLGGMLIYGIDHFAF